MSIIPRLHDQADSTSCYMLAGRSRSMFARSCKRSISLRCTGYMVWLTGCSEGLIVRWRGQRMAA